GVGLLLAYSAGFAIPFLAAALALNSFLGLYIRFRGAVRWVRVADRGADLYELLAQCRELGQGFVIRAAQDRGLVDPRGEKGVGRLFPTLRSQAAWASLELELRGRGSRPARVARLQVSTLRVHRVAPQRPGHVRGGLSRVACTALRVWEESPPEGVGVEPLEWVLLSDQEVSCFAQAAEVVQQYATRWLIEGSHKVLKTGLGAERLQLEHAERIFAAVALMSVVATRLLALREWVRLIPEALAEHGGLAALELEVLRGYTHQPLRTVGEGALARGRRGGHQGRKGDGMPGWLTLWRGMARLQTLVEGVRLARKIKTYG
ncbi:MAG: IS4 family transposase, partial [Meiothermus silvanus]|nr:IS4 family transposase [Allomeiothermus silvanus]